MSRENKMIIDENGEEQWISRSVVVLGLTLMVDEDNKLKVLVEKRGPAVSATGKWCVPCGYLDYDEDVTDAVIREIREETGYFVERNCVQFVDVESKPIGKKQNVVLRHIVILDENPRQIEGFVLDTNEVTELMWLEIGYITWDMIFIENEKLNSIKWAFNHKNDIVDILRKQKNAKTIKVI